MVTVRDISQILQHEKLKLKSDFQQQLTSALSHEQMTPLNAILNVTRMLKGEEGSMPMSKTVTKQMLDSIWSSAKILYMMNQSQLLHNKVNYDQPVLNFTRRNSSLNDLITNFLKPFLYEASQRKVSFQFTELNKIPKSMFTCWRAFEAILFHLLRNALKFS